MEYDFYRDITGEFRAECQLEHQVFAIWLTDELADNTALCQQIIQVTKQVLNTPNSEKRFIGKQYSLTLTGDSAIITANVESETPTSFHYEEELISDESAMFELDKTDSGHQDWHDQDDWSGAEAGLDDFLVMLESWLEFLQNG